VIAGLAVSYAAVPNELAALATAYVLLMAVFGPIAARVVELRSPSASVQLPTLEQATDECLAWLANPRAERGSPAPVALSPTMFE
jgi:hypothetical protein